MNPVDSPTICKKSYIQDEATHGTRTFHSAALSRLKNENGFDKEEQGKVSDYIYSTRAGSLAMRSTLGW